MPPRYLETFDKRKNFVKFLLCFYFWNLFSFYCWSSVQTEVWRVSESLNPTLAVKIYKEMMKYHSFPAIGHGFITTLFSNTFNNSFFFEKMWSNLRRQTIRWSITSALPNYWLGHKEGRKVGFCQILYIWHLFKVCLMYFLCMSSHSFCASKRGWHFTPKKWCLGPKYLGGIFFIQNLSQKLSTLTWDSFGGWLAQKLKIPLLCYHITQTSWHALFEDIGHRVRISNWCHHRSQIKKQNKMSFTPSYFEAMTSMAISSQLCF